MSALPAKVNPRGRADLGAGAERPWRRRGGQGAGTGAWRAGGKLGSRARELLKRSTGRGGACARRQGALRSASVPRREAGDPPAPAKPDAHSRAFISLRSKTQALLSATRFSPSSMVDKVACGSGLDIMGRPEGDF